MPWGNRPKLTIEERLWSRVNKTNTCWLWTGHISGEGYGSIKISGIQVKVHRVAYELEIGPIPNGLSLDHLCRVRLCVNPKHLEPVTHHENVLRGDSVTAQNARQTHCRYGHPFDEENTIIWKGRRSRQCRICCVRRHQESSRRTKEKRDGVRNNHG